MPKTSDLSVAFRSHPRRWQSNSYVYPVISRRSHGLSVGINLNPDKACNFDCLYCQVDRTVPPIARRVDLAALATELDLVLELAATGALFDAPPFSGLPGEDRAIRDIAFSGDGEPTTCPQFKEAVETGARARQRFGLTDAQLVLITDATYLTRPRVREALDILDRNNGEIWAKLDAGTDDYFQLVDRPNVSLQVVLDNIVDAARLRPIVIQSMFLRIDGLAPSWAEIDAYCERLNQLVDAGAQFKLLQLYTIARPPTESRVSALSDGELDRLAERVRSRVPVPADVFYGV